MISLLRTVDVIEGCQSAGLQIGAQLFIAQGGSTLVDRVWGESRPGVALTPETLMLWLSAGKPLTAMAIMQQIERGRCGLDDPVVKFLPTFGNHGKSAITIRHLLTHTAGFRWVETGWPEAGWNEIIANICAARPEPHWTPGLKAGYHPNTSWYILGELVQRLSGTPLRDYIRNEICAPLGLRDTWLGMTAETYRGYGNRLARLPNTEKPGAPSHPWSGEAGALHGAPGGGAYGPMHDLGAFYEALRQGGQGRVGRVLSHDSVTQMTSRQRVDLVDETFKLPIDWGLGLILDSKHYGRTDVPYGYGRYASPRTFGHSGSQSSVGFCDPEHELVVALAFNGMPGEARHQRRIRAVLDAIYEDLDLVTPSIEPTP